MEYLKTKYEEKINEEKHGIELYFNDIPTREEREHLKSDNFKWHSQKKCWYKRLDNNGKKTQKVKESKNYLGVKVGDIFYMSWGYEQTNVDFFRVKALKGTTQVVLQEVCLHMKEENAVSGMSADRTYDPKIAVPVESSHFVKDNEKGMIKKILGTKDYIYINMTSFANAYLYHGEKLYESWYY